MKRGGFELKYVVALILMIIVILFLFGLLGYLDNLKDGLVDFFRSFKWTVLGSQADSLQLTYFINIS